jgi:YesN/AraC family two-component response regulator
MQDLKKFQNMAHYMSILYVEDNELLSQKVDKLLKKFFQDVYVAKDGLEGLGMFNKYKPQIVVTDIKMPKMDGIELCKKITKKSPETKVIIMSAFDDTSYLLKSIEIGIFRFIKKPVNIAEFSDVLYDAVVELKKKQKELFLNSQLTNIFNNQSSMVLLLHNFEPVMVNHVFLDFFGVENMKQFYEKYTHICKVFSKQDGFLYDDDEILCMNKIISNKESVFNVKIKSIDGSMHHFVLKYKVVDHSDNYSILSFDDMTSLQLIDLNESEKDSISQKIEDEKDILDIFSGLQRKDVSLEFHNFYKELSITNYASIVEVKERSVVFSTHNNQQKAMQFENTCLIVGDYFMYNILCENIISISFREKTVELGGFRYVQESAISRATTRVVPEDDHEIKMFIDEEEFLGNVHIKDISLDGIRIETNALPLGFDRKDVYFKIVFTMDKESFEMVAYGEFLREKHKEESFELVFSIECESAVKSKFIKYITKRQMAIIREFKGRQIEE